MRQELADPARRVAGTRQIARAAAQGRLHVVYLAKDADDKIRAQVKEACEASGVRIEEAESMAALGEACRIAVKAAAAGILKAEEPT